MASGEFVQYEDYKVLLDSWENLREWVEREKEREDSVVPGFDQYDRGLHRGRAILLGSICKVMDSFEICEKTKEDKGCN